MRPCVRLSHLTSKWRIWGSGTLVTKGETHSDQMEGPKIYSQKKFCQKYFHRNYFHQKCFCQKYFWKNIQIIFGKKYVSSKIFLKKYSIINISGKNIFTKNISEKKLLTTIFLKILYIYSPPCCPQGLGWYRAIARSQPSATYWYVTISNYLLERHLCNPDRPPIARGQEI